MVWSWLLLLQDKFKEKEKENIKLTEDMDQVKKQSENLQSTVEQQQKETEHLKVCGAELHGAIYLKWYILHFNQPCNNTAEMWAWNIKKCVRQTLSHPSLPNETTNV